MCPWNTSSIGSFGCRVKRVQPDSSPRFCLLACYSVGGFHYHTRAELSYTGDNERELSKTSAAGLNVSST